MRVNVYNEELTDEVSVVKTTANDQTFYGVRIWLRSPSELHNLPTDDDRSAVTIWFGDRDRCHRVARALGNSLDLEYVSDDLPE
jgi:hypothetical protein